MGDKRPRAQVDTRTGRLDADAGQDRNQRPLTGLGAFILPPRGSTYPALRRVPPCRDRRRVHTSRTARRRPGHLHISALLAYIDLAVRTDLPDVLDFKQRVLDNQAATPSGTRATVPVDPCEAWSGELLTAGSQRAAPTAWLAEGLLSYLSHQEAATMLTVVGELPASRSRLPSSTAPEMTTGSLPGLSRCPRLAS